jgi:hypothetical protein
MTETKEERVAYAQKLKFDLAVRDHADKLSDDWTNAASGARRLLSSAYELLHPSNVRQAVVQSCLESVRAYDPGTMSRPTDEGRVAQLYCQGKFEILELPHLHQFLNSWTVAALRQGHLVARGLDVATSKRRAIAADEWQSLQPDFERGTASVDGRPIVYGIEVEAAKTASKLSRPSSALRRTLVKKWYVDDYIPACEPSMFPSRDLAWTAAQEKFPDFTDRTWFREMREAHKPAGFSTGPGRPRKLAGRIGG